jgi:hypothetical protein
MKLLVILYPLMLVGLLDLGNEKQPLLIDSPVAKLAPPAPVATPRHLMDPVDKFRRDNRAVS